MCATLIPPNFINTSILPVQAPDDIQAPLREARLDQDSCIRLPEFKQLLSARLLDPLDMFESRLVQSQ